MEKIVFVSSINTVIGQITECLFNASAIEKGLTVRAISCGVAAANDEELPFPALKALWLRGVDTEGCVSRSYSEEIFNSADLIVALNKQIKFLLPKSDKVTTVGELSDGDEFTFAPSFEIGEYLDICYTVDKFADKLTDKIKNGDIL
jgi:protein-tyrosine-phosphatase